MLFLGYEVTALRSKQNLKISDKVRRKQINNNITDWSIQLNWKDELKGKGKERRNEKVNGEKRSPFQPVSLRIWSPADSCSWSEKGRHSCLILSSVLLYSSGKKFLYRAIQSLRIMYQLEVDVDKLNAVKVVVS